MKKKEELKKELEELNNDALLIYKPEWSDFEGKKLEAWTEYVTEYGWSEEIQLRLEEFEEQYEDCMQCGIDPDYLFTQDEMEENHLCDDDSEYCGDDFLINTGWVYNECIKRWIHRDDLPIVMSRSEFADLTGEESDKDDEIIAQRMINLGWVYSESGKYWYHPDGMSSSEFEDLTK